MAFVCNTTSCSTFAPSCSTSSQPMCQSHFVPTSDLILQTIRSPGVQVTLGAYRTDSMPQLGTRLFGTIRGVGNGFGLSYLEVYSMKKKKKNRIGRGVENLRISSWLEARSVVSAAYTSTPEAPRLPGRLQCVGGVWLASTSPSGDPICCGRFACLGGRQKSETTVIKALSSSYGAESLSTGDHSNAISDVGEDRHVKRMPATPQSPVPSRYKSTLQVVCVLAALVGMGMLAALGLTLNSRGSSALLSVVAKSGFPAAFALIFVSEIGDQTFFIAALLAMRHSKWLVLLGASAALSVMTMISVVIGKLFQRVPAQLQTTLPVGEYAAVALLVWFGLRSIKLAWDTPSVPPGVQGQSEELGELAGAEKFLKQAEEKKSKTPLEVLGEAFTLVFLAEWGDRSMMATIALGAAQSPWGVASGAIAGHVLATLLAVLGGSFLSRYLSEKLIGYIGGILFLAFAAATLAGFC